MKTKQVIRHLRSHFTLNNCYDFLSVLSVMTDEIFIDWYNTTLHSQKSMRKFIKQTSFWDGKNVNEETLAHYNQILKQT